jgi:uncharacterized membrane protein
MASIIALVYPDAATADAAAETLKGLEEAGYLKIHNSAVITKDADGKVENKGEHHTIRRGAVTGGVLGVVAGAIFALPVAGLAAGAAIGGWVGKALKTSSGGDFPDFKKQLESDLQPGGAALLIFGETNARERVVQELSRHGGTVRSTDFSDEQVAEIQRELDHAAGT